MMHIDRFSADPLVSVIIPCFNHGRFIGEAIASVQKQSYPNTEIIVVDDGSKDNTREVASSYAGVRYIEQRNAGLSASRNTGMANSRGLFLVFLDADDVLYADGLKTNLDYLLQNPSWAFVAGAHDKTDAWLNPLNEAEESSVVLKDHYRELLCGNFIGMHAAVMYRRTVFSDFQFDTSLRACEDYDLYLKITRHYPVGCHGKKIAAYRLHGENMSAKHLMMLDNVLKVHGRQKPLLDNPSERQAWQDGLRVWKHYYANVLYKEHFNAIKKNKEWAELRELRLMAEVLPRGLKNYIVKKTRHNLRASLKRGLPDVILKWLHQAGWYRHYTPRPGKVRTGDFNRLTPFSTDFGFDRGGAIDRFYIEAFLHENRDRVRGRVLEIGDNAYTVKFGAEKVVQSDVLHINSENSRATYIGDITDVPQVPSAAFDCIIFTQTLHLIYDFTSALKTCHRILKPGGCLLLTVPGISHIDPGAWHDYWLWSFTDASIKRLMTDTFGSSSLVIKTYGNVYVAAAFLYGMGLPEFNQDSLSHHDPAYQVIISAAAIKH